MGISDILRILCLFVIILSFISYLGHTYILPASNLPTKYGKIHPCYSTCSTPPSSYSGTAPTLLWKYIRMKPSFSLSLCGSPLLSLWLRHYHLYPEKKLDKPQPRHVCLSSISVRKSSYVACCSCLLTFVGGLSTVVNRHRCCTGSAVFSEINLSRTF